MPDGARASRCCCTRICSATPAPPTCWTPAPISALFRSCSAMPILAPPRAICMCRSSGYRPPAVNEHRLEVADVFRQHGEEFLERWGDVLSPQQRKAFRDIRACRTAALGEFVQQCDHCSHQVIQFKSCRNRHCPKCHRRARDQWLAARAEELLPVPYSHVVFTLPHELAPLG